MGFIGVQPATVPLTSSDITDGIITTAKIADTAVSTAKIADDAITVGKLPSGTVIQTVVSTSTANQVMTSSTYADIPSGGHQVTITPKLSTSKILLMLTGTRISYTTTNGISSLKIVRSIDGASFTDVDEIEYEHYVQGAYAYSRSATLYDSPSTTTAVIYKVQGKSTGTGNAHYTYSGVPAVLTALEIKQ
tara:strand:- start:205 stop:777 length:573 start_codon:yes stop_codon:yes gene_type:complete